MMNSTAIQPAGEWRPENVTPLNVGTLYETVKTCFYPWNPPITGSINYNSLPLGPSKFEQAFKVAAMLLKDGLVAECPVSQFVDLVRKIQAEL